MIPVLTSLRLCAPLWLICLMAKFMDKKNLVLHGLAIKKHGTPAQVAALTDLDEAEVQALLKQASENGRAAESNGKYMLTPTAQMALKGEYSKVYGGLRADEKFTHAYESFERINLELKDLITRWQTLDVGGEQISNDHSNPEHDAKIIDALGELHERAEPILDALAAKLPRLSLYKAHLLAALEKAEDGDRQWVSDAKCASYHTVWFELHEDLLRITGQQRQE